MKNIYSHYHQKKRGSQYGLIAEAPPAPTLGVTNLREEKKAPAYQYSVSQGVRPQE